MAYPGGDVNGGRRVSHNNYGTEKPRLPSFDCFIRSTGHNEPPYRSSNTPDTAVDNPSLWQPSLPTPPLTVRSGWCEGYQVKQEQTRTYSFREGVQRPPDNNCRQGSEDFPPQMYASPYSAHNGTFYDADRQAIELQTATWPHGHVTHEEMVPGKGLCYVYSDGTICPKEIDGNIVNPKWGTTKAGKPRKRLGQACNTCREKKVRCEPNHPKCSQCQRFNRECTFDVNTRQARESPNLPTSTSSPSATASISSSARAASRRSSVIPTDTSTHIANFIDYNSTTPTASHETSPSIMSARHTGDTPTPSKRPRISRGLPDNLTENNVSDTKNRDENSNPLDAYAANVDPLTVHDGPANEYLHAFMDYVNIPTFELLPRQRFLKWTTSNRKKTTRENLVLYAFIAMGTIHSHQPDRSSHRRLFKRIVREQLAQLEAEAYDLELAHITLILALTDFVDGEHNTGYSTFVRAIGCVTWLQLNLEKSQPAIATAYGFPATIYMECRRRTYWAAFTFDTFACFAIGDPRLLHKSNAYLKLPCASNLYESGSIPDLPIFSQDNVLSRTLTKNDHLQFGDMAYFLQITVIFSDVQLNAWHYRMKFTIGHQVSPSDRSAREDLESRLKIWADTYNQALRIRSGNTRDPLPMSRTATRVTFQAGKSAWLDLLYHYAAMELNRRIYHQNLTESEILKHAGQANIHAVEMLQLAQQVVATEGQETGDYIYVTRGPLTGYAVFTAIDILTAAGRLGDVVENRSKIMELMYAGLSLLEKVSHYWSSAQVQHDLVKRRIQAVFFVAQRALEERKTFFYCTDSMTPLLEKELDLVYGTNRKRYLRAAYVTDNTINDNDIFEVDAKAIAATRPSN